LSNIPNLIEALREAIGRSDNNKANETTLALFEAISDQFNTAAETDAKIIDQIARAPERKAILVETQPASPTASAVAGPETVVETTRDPLDHDNNGKNGGSVAKKKSTTTAKDTK
jgi:hypothetical protein